MTHAEFVLPPCKLCNPIKSRICGGCNWTQHNVLQMKIAPQSRIISKIQNTGTGAGRQGCLWVFFFSMTFSLAQGNEMR